MTVRLDLANAPTEVRDLVAQVRAGHEVAFSDGDKVIAKLVPFEELAERRGYGMYKGRIWMADDFDAPLGEEELKDWGMA